VEAASLQPSHQYCCRRWRPIPPPATRRCQAIERRGQSIDSGCHVTAASSVLPRPNSPRTSLPRPDIARYALDVDKEVRHFTHYGSDPRRQHSMLLRMGVHQNWDSPELLPRDPFPRSSFASVIPARIDRVVELQPCLEIPAVLGIVASLLARLRNPATFGHVRIIRCLPCSSLGGLAAGNGVLACTTAPSPSASRKLSSSLLRPRDWTKH